MQGHLLEVPRAARGIARFNFAQICEAPLGPADYLKLGREFHTLIIDAIPVMPTHRVSPPFTATGSIFAADPGL